MKTKNLSLFLAGDVMIGRGIDQILPFPSETCIYESYARDARAYVELAKNKNGNFRFPVDWQYIWGRALIEWQKKPVDLKIINLETSITTNSEWEAKGINYRMNPKNIAVLESAKMDVCTLSNNHILDWGERGLGETLDVLQHAQIKHCGAGGNIQEAQSPAKFVISNKHRALIFSVSVSSCGVPDLWRAGQHKSGVFLLDDLSKKGAVKLSHIIKKYKSAGDLVILSIHWGGNWGYSIPKIHQEFAHALIGEGCVDVIQGHSSHHPLGIEVFENKLIIYGCGDFINDYEGIGGYEEYRSDLVLMYFPKLRCASGNLLELHVVVLKIKQFSLTRASFEETQWMRETLNRESARYGVAFELAAENSLSMVWGDVKSV